MKTYYKSGLFFVGIAFLFITYNFFIAEKKQEDKVVSLLEFKNRVANTQKMVLVYFSADWCAICAKTKPMIAEIENQFANELDVLRIDTERDKEVKNEFEIDGLPLLMLFKNGERKWIYVGLIDKTELKTTIESFN